MTFSIVGQDGEAFGVAVASRFPCVGAVVPAARLGAGAAATQAMARVSYRDEALDRLGSGLTADDAVGSVTGADDERAHRQLGLVGRSSQASYTGSLCLDWAGGRSGRDQRGGYAVQGNILAGEAVIEAMEQAWVDGLGTPLPQRLLETLLAGDSAGGDRRGKQSAALYAVAPGAGYDGCGVLADIRVDDHPEAPGELARLLEVHDLVFGEPEELLPLEGRLAEEVRSLLARLGHEGADVDGALAAWAGAENYEMRVRPGRIDALVLAALRRTGA